MKRIRPLRVGKMQCPACHIDISSAAIACRQCGNAIPESQLSEQRAFEEEISRRAKKFGPYLNVGLVLALLGIGTCTYRVATREPTTAEIAKAKSDEERQAQQVKEYEAGGTAIDAVKGRMKNPRSFELVGAKAMPGKTDDGEPGWIVAVTYRGTNSFGGVTTSNALVSVSDDRSTALKVIDIK